MICKTKLLYGALLGAVTLIIPLTLTSASVTFVKANNEYSITLDEDNGRLSNQTKGYASNENLIAYTDNNHNPITFGYKNGMTVSEKAKSSYVIQLSKNGAEFYNVSPILGIKSINVTYDSGTNMSLYLSTSKNDTSGNINTIISGQSVETNDNYSYFTIKTGSKFAEIKEIVINYTCTTNNSSSSEEPSTSEDSSSEEVITISGLTIEGNLNKTNYTENDEWDLSGLTLKAKYSDGTSASLGALESVVGLSYQLDPAAPSKNATSLRIYDVTYEGVTYKEAERVISGITVTSNESSSEENESKTIRFELGTNGNAIHADGASKTSYSETVGGYTLSLTDGIQMYTGAVDAKGNGSIKLGSSKNTGSFKMTALNDVSSVNFYLSGYKDSVGVFTINGTTHNISTISNNGEYTCVTVDTSSTKEISLSTTSTQKRGMINAIEYIVGSSNSGSDNEEPETPDTPTLTSVTIQGDMTYKSYNEGDNWNLAGLSLYGKYSDENTAKIADITELLTDDNFDYELSPANAIKDTTSLTISILYTDELFEASKTITGITVTPKQNDEPVENGTYTLVNANSDLKIGSKVVIAENTKGFTAGSLSGKFLTNVISTFSNDKSTITNLGEGTIEYTLGGTSGAYTLTNPSGQKLGCSSKGTVTFTGGTTTWDITVSSGNATIQNGTSSYGRFLYNVNSPRFTTYTSDTSSTMLIVQLYILSSSGGDTPSTPEDDTTTNSGSYYAPNAYSYRTQMGNYNELDEISPYDCDSAPSVGNINVLVVPIAFNDSNENTQKVLDDLNIVFNGNETNTGWESVSTYFSKCSYGKLDLSFTVAPTWYQYNESKSNMGVDDGTKTENAVDSAVNWYKQTYSSNCQEFDSDSNGYIDCVFLVYAEKDYVTSNNNYSNFWAYTFWTQNGNKKISSPNANTYIWMSYDFMYGDMGGSKYINLDSHTFIHEYGHAMGLDDYYDYGGKESCGGGFDMQDYNVGDHNSFSKMALGWSKPYVVNGDATITIKPSSLYENQSIIIPAGGYNSWNKSPFDEYIMIEYYTPEGLNEFDANHQTYKDYPTGTKEKGLKVYHIDARLYSLYVSDQYLYYGNYSDTISSSYYYLVAASNSSSGDNRSKIAPNYRLVHLLSQSGTDRSKNGQTLSLDDLFLKDDTFSMSTFSSYFYNRGKMNDGSALGFTFKVTNITDEGATIQFTKI